jgi:hypothetical protein
VTEEEFDQEFAGVSGCANNADFHDLRSGNRFTDNSKNGRKPRRDDEPEGSLSAKQKAAPGLGRRPLKNAGRPN